ncbi:hypothetical protein A9Z07_02255 [Acinetobacter sp. YK3]|nr:hypothetical protein A9Z07_02255 [Acinetobacter sp. YK3]
MSACSEVIDYSFLYINYFAIKQLETDFSISYFLKNILQINDINKLFAKKNKPFDLAQVKTIRDQMKEMSQ